MNILIPEPYFYPEITADSHLENDLISYLCSSGHNVFVVCPLPSRGIDDKIRKEYKTKKFEELNSNKLKVYRFWSPKERRNAFLRAFRYFWCNLMTIRTAKRIKNSIDLVYCISTPPTQGLVAGRLKKYFAKKNKQKKTKFLFYLEDLFPDSLVSSRILKKKNGLIWKIGKIIERKVYDASDMIFTISNSFKDSLIKRGVCEQKIMVVPNWIDIESVKMVEKDNNTLFDLLGIRKTGFHAVYAGNLGESQNIGMLLDVARILKNDKTIDILIFGSGGYEKELRKKILEDCLSNVFLFPLQPKELVSSVYSLGDINLVMCKKGFGQCALPSKTWTIFGTQRPVLASYDLNSELAYIIKSEKSGMVVEPDNPEQLAEAILYFSSLERKTIDDMGKNGRIYVLRERSKEKCLSHFENYLKSI